MSNELGLVKTIYMLCRDDGEPIGAEEIGAFLDALPGGEGCRPIVASTAGLTAHAARLAQDHHVSIWDESALLRIERS